MDVSILAVGTELLFGQVINSNAAYLSKNLNMMGFNVMYHYVVGDNPRRLEESIAEAFAKSDIVITTGGLGPTQDDLTKETISKYMGVELYKDERAIAEIEGFFKKFGRPMAKNNVKQAYMPVGCTVLYNASGTAPGFALEKDGKIAIALPGPPREVKWLYENGVKDYLEKFLDKKMFYKVIRTIGIGESDLETVLLPLIDGQTDPTIATYAKEGECSLRVASQRATLSEAEAAVDEMIEKVNEIVGEYVYSTEDQELKEVVVSQLAAKGLKLSSAESCTAGKFAAAITDVAGSSKVYDTGYVTYSVDAKVRELGLDRDMIEREGVVSPSVAIAMAKNAMEKSGSDVAVSITGYAGPEADEGHSVGEAYIGYASTDKSGFIAYNRDRRRRDWNRDGFTLAMLRTVYLLINDKL